MQSSELFLISKQEVQNVMAKEWFKPKRATIAVALLVVSMSLLFEDASQQP